MSDLLRVSCIVSLALGIIASPVIYFLEAIFEHFHFLGFFLAVLLGLAQIVMLVVFCTTKNVRTITSFLIIVTRSSDEFLHPKKKRTRLEF